MSELRYPGGMLRGDYIRAGIGLALTLIPATMVPAGSTAFYILLAAALLFLAFGWRTWSRQHSRVVVDSEGISLFSPRRVSLAWKNINSVRLSYYSLKSDRTGGWMQLTLKGVDWQQGDAFRAIRLDSALEGFDGIVRRAAAAAIANGVAINDATRVNLGSIGIDLMDLAPAREDR
jgi:hypothetical protein